MEQQFKSLVSEVVSPALKENGFRRRGATFERGVETFTQLVNVQRSSYNHKQLCSFTFNTGIYVPSVAETYFERGRAPRHPSEPASILRQRGGSIAGGNDRWFRLTPDADERSIREAVDHHVRADLVPHLDRLRSREAIIEAMSRNGSEPQQAVFRAIFLAREVDAHVGVGAMKALVSSASHPGYRASLESTLERLLEDLRAPQE